MSTRIIILGDIVGTPGRQAVNQIIPQLKEKFNPHLIIANAENAANGTGLTPELYRKICNYGVDAITLGDHVYKKQLITKTLEQENNIIRPANLSKKAIGKTLMKLIIPPTPTTPSKNIYIFTLLGRVFMNHLPASCPFQCADEILAQIPDKNPIIIAEIHAETTSEKQAIGWYLNGRVSAVFGTHTHVQTNDPRILNKGTAYITDLGMCGPQESILGRDIKRVLKHMTTNMPAPFDVAQEDPRLCGIYLEISDDTQKAIHIETLQIKANTKQAPWC